MANKTDHKRFWKDPQDNIHVATIDGKQVGIVQDKDGRLRPSGHAKPKWRNDPAYAVNEWNKWVAARTGIEPITDSIAVGDYPTYRDHIRSLILTDLTQARIELDLPTLSLDGPVPVEFESLRLDEIGKLYAGKRFSDPNESKRSADVWQEFCTAVRPAVTVAQVTEDRLTAYHGWLYQHRTPAHKSTAKVGESVLLTFDRWAKERRKKTRDTNPILAKKTINNRIRKVASILKYASDHRKKHRGEIQELLTDFRKICKAPKNGKGKGKATPIHPDDFAALLEVADTQWTAQLLLMLNCGMHPGEMADTRVEDIDFRRKTLANRREKTEIERVAMLWPRTIKAIQEYRKEKPHKSPLLFVSRFGTAWTTNQLNKRFAEFRQAAGLPDSVKMDDIRDGARTAASDGNANPEHTAMLMGHELPGSADHYVHRSPALTRDVVDAIDAYYFPPKKQASKKKRGKK